MDAHKNFAISAVAIPPSPADSGLSLVITTGTAALFPAVPFNATISPANTMPTLANSEIVRVTNISTDTLTITRAQESTGSRLVQVGDVLAVTVTAKSFTDIENLLATAVFPSTGFAGSLVFSDAASKIVPGATSFAIRDNADSANNLLISDAGLVTARAGVLVASGAVTISDTASKIVPGATSLSLRNHADSADNILVSDAGLATVRAGVTLTAGALTFGAAASKIVPGGTSLSLRNNADSADNLLVSDAGDATLRARLLFATASSKIVPGANSISFRNNADTLSHATITDVGQVTVYPETAATGFVSTNIGIQFGTTSNTYTTPVGVGSVLVRVDGNFKNTTDGTGYWRALSTEVHWTDTAHGASTFAGVYANVYHDGTGQDVQDLIGVIGRVYITVAATSSVGTWGVRGDLNFSAAATVTRGANVVSHQGAWSGGATVTTMSGLEHRAHTWNTGSTAVTDGYGALIEHSSGASGNNVDLMIGTRISGSIPALGLFVGSNGAWFKGNGTATAPLADTTNAAATVALAAGNNSAANDTLCALYFYRSTTSQGYVGFDSNVAQVNAGHTKVVGDLVLGSVKLLVDVNGQIWSANNVAGNSMSIVPAVKTSGTVGTSFTYTGAAHTGLTLGAVNEFNWNANRVITFATAGGGGTIATAHTFQFQRAQYASDVATTITLGTTVRITGAPSNSSNITFGTNWALYLDSGASNLYATTFNGSLTIVDTFNINLSNSGTGTKIGTSTAQLLGFWNKTPVVQPTLGATIVNNVTSGGTTKQIDNFTDLVVYANDAAAIRNDIYQISAVLKIVIDNLRLTGLMS